MLKNSKIFKSLCMFTTFGLIGSSAVCAKSNGVTNNKILNENQKKLKSKSDAISDGRKTSITSDDIDFEDYESNFPEKTAVNGLEGTAPYVAMAVAPPLAIASYGVMQKVLESKDHEKESENGAKNNWKNRNDVKNKKDEMKNSEGTNYALIILIIVIFIVVICVLCKLFSENDKRLPDKSKENPKILREYLSEYYNSFNEEELLINEEPNDYLADLKQETGMGKLPWQACNCFILSGIYTQFCKSLDKMNSEIDEALNAKGITNDDRSKIFVLILKKRLEKRRKEEPNRFIWIQCESDLEKLEKKGNEEKLKRFVTCALNVITYSKLNWAPFMKNNSEQYNEENNLFGQKVYSGKPESGLYNFRSKNDQGAPADALGGMGIRLADVGGSAFDYTKEGIPLVPENNFPYRQVLDKNSEFVTMQYDEKDGFTLIDKTLLSEKAVVINLGQSLGDEPFSYGEKGAIGKEWTVNSVNGNKGYYAGRSIVEEGKEEEVKEKAKSVLAEFREKENNIGFENIVEEYVYVTIDKTGKERHFGSRELYNDAVKRKENLDGNENLTRRLKCCKFNYREKLDKNIVPEVFQEKRMYIGAIGYVRGGAAGRGGHCQALEPKYEWDDKKGCYKIVRWVDRNCYTGADEVIDNKEAIRRLKLYLGKYDGRAEHTRFGACRLITEQVIDDCPGQYCYNTKTKKAEHTEERQKQLEEKKNNNIDYKTVQEINSVEGILNEIKREHPEWFKEGDTAKNEKHNMINSMIDVDIE